MTAVQKAHFFKPPGPVAQAFFDCRKERSMIMGPFGSAKTSTLINKIFTLSVIQKPSPIDGVRYTRWLAVRDTYRQLEKTTIPSWKEWTVDKGIAPKGFTGGRGGNPGQHVIDLALPDGTRMHSEVHFIAIEDGNVKDILGGYNITGGWLNEADLVAEEVFDLLPDRCGRYPSMMHGGPSWKGMLCDYNAPDVDHHFYKLCEEDRPPDVGFYRQPGGMDPDAENLENLPGGRAYYEGMIARNSKKPWIIARNVHNTYAYSRDGKPVYVKYDDRRHVSTVPLKPIKGLPLLLGLDAGRTPAAVIGQETPSGQVRVLREFVRHNIAGPAFGEALGEYLGKEFPGFYCEGDADPSAVYASENSDDLWVEQVSNAADITIQPALTNKLLTRLGAVESLLDGTIDAGTPRFILDPSCKILRKGFNSGYKYRKIKNGAKTVGDEQYSEEPLKNDYSHPHDALQYLAMRILGERALRGHNAENGRSAKGYGTYTKPGGEIYDPFDLYA